MGMCLAVLMLSGCGSAVNTDTDTSGADSTDMGGAASQSTERIAPRDIVFGSNTSGNYEIYRMSQDGSGLQRLTSDPAYDNWWPRISPDREKVLYYRAPYGENGRYESADLMVMDADGSNIGLLRASGDDDWSLQAHAEWSPDGSELVMCGGRDGVVNLFVTDAIGAQTRQLTFDGSWNCDPSWSPDGRSIVFNRCENDCGSHMAGLEIYSVSASGGAPHRLTSNATADYDPYYSPDGTSIAWLVNADPDKWSGIGAWSIHIMDADGGRPRNVIDDGQLNSKPAWSLNGDRIFFHRLTPAVDAVNRWRIFSIHPDGTQLTDIDPFDAGQSEYPSN